MIKADVERLDSESATIPGPSTAETTPGIAAGATGTFPLAPPVMTATRPSNLPAISSSPCFWPSCHEVRRIPQVKALGLAEPTPERT